MDPRRLTFQTPVDELVDACEPGWPRPTLKVPWRNHALPLPWINGANPAFERTGWKMMCAERLKGTERRNLCFCCGEPLTVRVMGRHVASFQHPDIGAVWLTDGPAGHPRCIALAAETCPHLRKQHRGRPNYVIAFAYGGNDRLPYTALPPELTSAGKAPRFIVHAEAQTLTLGELRDYARRDPLGVSLPSGEVG